MRRGNPLIADVWTGLARGGPAQLDGLRAMLLQAAVLLLWWPKSDVAQMLESEYSPRTLAAVVMAIGLTAAYHALRAGAEEILLPGERGLRVWAHETALHPARIVSGCVSGQLLHSAYLLLLSTPLMLMAFTVSGGEWPALAWCVAAIVVQALFYRLCGAIIGLTLEAHVSAKRYAVRALLLVVYVPTGLLAPLTSHLAITYRTLGEPAAVKPAAAAMPDAAIFISIYAAAGVIAALVVHRLLWRARGGPNRPVDAAKVDRVATG
jgi:hypothetical protein